MVVVDWEGRGGRSAEQVSEQVESEEREEARTYLRSGPGARRQVSSGRRRAPPAATSCKIYKKRCEERRGDEMRGETLAGARRCREREGKGGIT